MSNLDTVLEASARIGSPLLLAATGELLLERAGVINIGIEGVMLAGAFAGFAAALASGSPWLGALVGAAAGILLMLLFALVVLRFRADAIVTGMALNLVALGVTGVAAGALSASVGGLAEAPRFTALIPAARDWPLVGPLFFAQSPLTVFALLLVPAVWWYLSGTERGLEWRAVGEHPAAAEASGIDVLHCRWKACAIAGALGGLGGAFLVVSQTGAFTPNCTAGRGFVALSAVVLGRYHAAGTALACLLFGTAFYARDAIASTTAPTEWLEALPYILALIALCVRWRGAAPAALGQPYHRA